MRLLLLSSLLLLCLRPATSTACGTAGECSNPSMVCKDTNTCSDCCGPGNFWAIEPKQCYSCYGNTFTALTCATAPEAYPGGCTLCPAGKYSERGRDVCLDCPPGSYCPVFNDETYPPPLCPPGTSRSLPGAERLEDCAPCTPASCCPNPGTADAPTCTASPSPSPTGSPTGSPSASDTLSPSPTPTLAGTPSDTPSPTPTASESPSGSPSPPPTPSPPATPPATPPASSTGTVTPTRSGSPTPSGTGSATAAGQPPPTASPLPPPTPSPTPTHTPSPSPTDARGSLQGAPAAAAPANGGAIAGGILGSLAAAAGGFLCYRYYAQRSTASLRRRSTQPPQAPGQEDALGVVPQRATVFVQNSAGKQAAPSSTFAPLPAYSRPTTVIPPAAVARAAVPSSSRNFELPSYLQASSRVKMPPQ